MPHVPCSAPLKLLAHYATACLLCDDTCSFLISLLCSKSDDAASSQAVVVVELSFTDVYQSDLHVYDYLHLMGQTF